MKQREKILIQASWVSIIGNAILSVLKMGIGLFAGSLAVLGDGIDSATDVVISIVTLITARIVSRPPNSNYAYGYEKADSVATKVLSFVIFFAGIQMLISTGKSIIFAEPRELPSVIAIYVTILSMFGKLGLAYYQFHQGKLAESSMLIANAKNMRNDVIISSGVLLGLLFTFVLNMPILDSITGLLISIYIIKSSIDIFLESNVVLMDGVKDTSVYKKIFEAVEQVPGASNPHRVRSRQIGNLYMIVLDIEIDGDLTLNEAHDIANEVEQGIKSSIANVYDIVVHLEPQGKHHEEEKFGLNKDLL
ncbi:cation diffusion facilitator family transporter [uncultured Bacteroides sp.]|uniref:cation diffusion facilitator family transporter n=1 Tax=uncultured Bacteroides sp. TaxID=162156 RepID=UPI002AA950CE|nr:cation diffusion facilitator family transporter [uncultured Bacteroides sp.]